MVVINHRLVIYNSIIIFFSDLEVDVERLDKLAGKHETAHVRNLPGGFAFGGLRVGSATCVKMEGHITLSKCVNAPMTCR